MLESESPFHVLESQQFSLLWLDKIFRLAKEMSRLSKSSPHLYKRILEDKVMATLFYEPSTRTRFSFEMAMLRLGGKVISTENAAAFSSVVKGETLEDTIRVISDDEPDVIVLRHPKAEWWKSSSAAISGTVPIINAGDGNNQHPTQALTDFFTIQDKIAYSIDNPLRIAMVGDLVNGRTVRSLCYLLAKFSRIVIYFVSPPRAAMKDDIKEYLAKHGVLFFINDNLEEVAPQVDVLYQTRIQKERGTAEQDFDSGKFTVTWLIAESMQNHAIIMHPLPKNKEIEKEVDQNKRAYYFQQAKNGLYIRMALLKMMLAPNA